MGTVHLFLYVPQNRYSFQAPWGFHVAELFAISGTWDFTVVLIAKDHEDFAIIKSDIKEKFSNIINEWLESPTSFAYKFERYDMLNLMGYKKNK